MRLHTSLIALLVALSPVAVLPAFAQDTGAHAASQSDAAAITIGDIAISGAFSRATLPNAPVGGGFQTITNNGAEDDALISASAPIARETQIHEMSMEGDVMKMRQLTDGIPVPAGQAVTLEPGGLHIMFTGLNAPIVEGQTIPVTLTFEKSGTVTFDMAVGSAAADGPAHDMSGHGTMNHGTMDHGAAAGHDGHAAQGHGDAASHHGSGTAVDQSGLSDIDAIGVMQKAMFDTPDNPLAMGPIVVSGDYAVSDWAQTGMGGRALLRKTAKGWGIHLCAGAGLKDAAELVKIGVPEAQAADLAAQLAAAEASLPPESIALYDSFDGTMMVDGDLI